MKIKTVFLAAAAAVLLGLVFAGCYSNPKGNVVFTVDDSSPKIEAGSLEAQFDKTLALMGLKKGNIDVEYYPLEDAVCLKYKLDFYNYQQFWDRKGRDAFINALELYKADYGAKALGRKGTKKTLKKYGTVYGYLIWQMFQYTTKAKGNSEMELGFYFRDNSPYFTVNQKETLYDDPLTERDIVSTIDITLYFTRAQADEVAALFNQDLLDELTAKKAGSYNQKQFSVDYDEY